MRKSSEWTRLYCVAICLLAAATGCQKADSLPKNPTKDRITAEPVKILPLASNGIGSYSKAGHLVQIRQKVSANKADENLVLNYSQRGPKALLDSRAYPDIVFSRSTSIAKEQSKNIEGSVLLFGYPAERDSQNLSSFESTQIDTDISDRSLGSTIGVLAERTKLMQDYQSSLIILSDNVDTQTFWNNTSVVEWPYAYGFSSQTRPFICTAINTRDIKDNFPNNFYELTVASTIYWNDSSANDLSDQQKQAILDWLNFGGRLIINGPQTIASLSNSFLTPYLPLTNLSPSVKDANELAATLDRFTIRHAPNLDLLPRTDTTGSRSETPAEEERASLSVKISNVDGGVISSGLCSATLSTGGNWVPNCEGLLAEARVDRGRICMSTFDMSGDKVTNWTSYGSFLHSAAFRLPSRKWSSSNGDPSYHFIGSDDGQEKNLSTYSNVRTAALLQGSNIPDSPSVVSQSTAWNEGRFNRLALNSLHTTSGIKVPPIDALTKMIGVYLLILVPANYCVFRVLNRLEWAWFSIPVIAVASAAVFAYTLQIQIGFARSQNSIGWLQLQQGYNRATLSRQISVYTSLSSRFRLSLPSDNGFVLPVRGQSLNDQNNQAISYVLNDEYGSGIRNHPIRSNTSFNFQSDELVDIGGVIEVVDNDKKPKIANNSSIQLQDVVWVRKRDNQTTFHWVGPFSPSVQMNLEETKVQTLDATLEMLRQSLPDSENDASENDLRDSQTDGIRQMFVEYLTSSDQVDNSDYVVGWTKNVISNLEVFPNPSQKNEMTLVSMAFHTTKDETLEKDLTLPPKNLHSKDINLPSQ